MTALDLFCAIAVPLRTVIISWKDLKILGNMQTANGEARQRDDMVDVHHPRPVRASFQVDLNDLAALLLRQPTGRRQFLLSASSGNDGVALRRVRTDP